MFTEKCTHAICRHARADEVERTNEREARDLRESRYRVVDCRMYVPVLKTGKSLS